MKERPDPRWHKERLASNPQIDVVVLRRVNVPGCEATDPSERQPVQQGEGPSDPSLQWEATILDAVTQLPPTLLFRHQDFGRTSSTRGRWKDVPVGQSFLRRPVQKRSDLKATARGAAQQPRIDLHLREGGEREAVLVKPAQEVEDDIHLRAKSRATGVSPATISSTPGPAQQHPVCEGT